MKRWFISLFFLIILTGSVPAGTAFADSGMDRNMCPMKCCKKKKARSAEPKKSETAICRTLNCSTAVPTNPNASAQVNLAPVLILAQKITLFQILFADTPKESVQPVISNQTRLNPFQPKYIQNLSLLI